MLMKKMANINHIPATRHLFDPSIKHVVNNFIVGRLKNYKLN